MAPVPDNESLVTAVERLADEVRSLRDVLDEIREDFSWVTRNGVPHQPQEHVIVKRMALDPVAGDWAEQLELVRLVQPGTTADSGTNRNEEMTAQVVATFEGMAQGQLEMVLSAFDSVREQMLAAVRKSWPPTPWKAEPETPPCAPEPPAVPPPPAEPPARGRLF